MPRRFHPLGLLLMLASFGGGWLWIDFQAFLDTPLEIPPTGLVHELKPGASVATLARDLEHQAVWRQSRHGWYFQALARWQGKAQRLRVGEYLIPTGTTPSALLDLFVSGRVLQHPVTLVEGWTFAHWREQLNNQDWLRRHLDPDEEPEAVMARLGRPGELPEGRLLPNTYHFPRGVSDLQVICRAVEAMDRFLASEWAKRDPGLPLQSPYEALILASIVEKETALAAERPRIAGVFVRRLRQRMKLQTDPTLIYGLGNSFDGNLKRADLIADTPYNTYLHPGLPPTPIAMPSGEAIRAVLHPAPGDALYFVARGDGSHQFSGTLEEHNRAVQQFQLKRP